MVAARRPEPIVALAADRESRGFKGAFDPLSHEHGFVDLQVEGRIPADLDGTLFRNGPGTRDAQGVPNGHLFDGDGAVSAVRLCNGKAQGAVRIIESAELLEERRRGRQLFKGFGTPGRGWHRFGGRVKNVANTNVLPWQGKLLAMFEAARPTELSIDDLSTIGETDLGGVVGQAFSAHPHRVASRRATYNFGLRYGARVELDLFELPDRGVARRMITLPMPRATMLHDFIVTDRHAVFFVVPYVSQLLKIFFGLSTIHESFSYKPELGTEVIVVPLDRPEDTARFDVDPTFLWHFANAFERGDEIVVDYCRYPDATSVDWLTDAFNQGPTVATASKYARAILRPRDRALAIEDIWDHSCEFPRVNPSCEGEAHRYAYMATHTDVTATSVGIQDAIAKLDVQTGIATEVAPGRGQFPSEPVFVPRVGATDEDDGYLLSLVYDAESHRSHVAVFDARGIDSGPVARAWFDHPIPLTFHGNWASR